MITVPGCAITIVLYASLIIPGPRLASSAIAKLFKFDNQESVLITLVNRNAEKGLAQILAICLCNND